MSRFERVLSNLNDQLDIPLSEKPEIIAEVAADLESFYEHYRKKGMNEQEAEEAAVGKVVADSTVLEQFQSLNTPALLRILEKLPKRVRVASEILVFVLMLAPFVVSGVFVITIPWLARRVFVWLLLANALPILYLGCMVIYRFYVLYPHDTAGSRVLLRKVLWFGFLAVLVGFDGFLWETLGIAETIASMGNQRMSLSFMHEFMIAGISNLSVGFLLGVITVLIWIAGSGKLARIEYHEDVVHRIIEH